MPADADPSQEAGISLDDLSKAFTAMLGAGDDPYGTETGSRGASADGSLESGESSGDPSRSDADAPLPDVDAGELSPRSILEAMLFVGTPDNLPLSSKQVAGLMRGVRSSEIDELVGELNSHYDENRCPYHIVAEGPGYRMELREQFRGLRDRFFGRVRQARLSQAAIEVLAIVAYNEPLTRDDVTRLRGKPSGSVLAQLVRRRLLRIDRDPEKRKKSRYFTTERFLELFGLESLADLPRSQEIDKR